MSVNDGIGIHMAITGIKPWFYLHKSDLCIKTKHPMHPQEKVGFFLPLGFATWFKIVCIRKRIQKS
jgi:hypothetical protein